MFIKQERKEKSFHIYLNRKEVINSCSPNIEAINLNTEFVIEIGLRGHYPIIKKIIGTIKYTTELTKLAL